MQSILNAAEVLQFGPLRLRQDALKIISSAVEAADPYQAALRQIQRKDDLLTIQSYTIDLKDWENIYVMGAGKATQRVALALEELLPDRITDGLIVIKRGEPTALEQIPVVYGTHPIPDQDSLKAGEALFRLASKARAKDLVITAFTGGSSALAILPVEGISWEDTRELNRLLQDSGATIFEINAVRKHVSRIKGGNLALEIFPAELICLTVSDVVGDQLDYITDLTVPDTSTIQDAWNTLEKYQLWERLPESIRSHLKLGDEIETPKFFSHSYHPFLLVPGEAAFQAAARICKELGYVTRTLEKELEGESSLEASNLLEAAEKLNRQGSGKTSCALVATGETIVRIDGESGDGGPNQEFALSAAVKIQNRAGMVVAAIDMDGTDGPTDAAGAIVDGETVSRGLSAGLKAAEYLQKHKSYDYLRATCDLIFSGPTGTNVNDLMFILIEPDGNKNTEEAEGHNDFR